VTVRAPAKVNLQLSVGPVGTDGYHPLATVFHAVSLYDEVQVRRGAPGSGIAVAARGEQISEVPLGPDNLAARAAAALAEQLDVAPDVAITLCKGIPVAGGMAGGSADAAATLVACAELWGCSPSDPRLSTVAAGLGADVPFGLLGGTAIGRGRGDRLTPVPVQGRFEWVFATAPAGLSTPAVYRRFDELALGREVPAPAVDDQLLAALADGDPAALGAALSNDLQDAAIALRPSLRTVIETGLAAGALGALVSGSGPTVAFLVESDSAAMALVRTLSPSQLCRSLRRAHGPVPGARIIAG
jgi:4-diphosphocytidyl-2-C-methyl-D-erythritol kinase